MKKTVAIALAAAGLLTASHAFAQANTSSASANTSVTIIRPLTITNTSDLAFGKVVQPRSGSDTVTLANTGNTVTTGGTAVALGGTTSRAVFGIVGEGGQAITVTVPASVSLTSGANTLSVTLSSDVSGSTTLSGALGDVADGTKAVNVGGSFTLGSGQASGAYTGSFTVTAAYQ